MELIAQDRALLGMAEQMSRVGCWRYDLRSGHVIWSPEVFRIHGLPVGSAVPTYAELLQLYEPGDATKLASLVDRAVRTGKGYELEALVRRPNGEVRHVLAKAQCIVAANGEVASLCGVFQDVTERISTERLIRVLGDHLPGMVAYWDADLKCRFANGAYQEWFGRGPSQMIGISLAELLGPALFEANEPYVRGALAGQIQVFERVITKPSGQIGHTLVQYVPDRDEEARTRGMYVLIADVGLLKEAELTALSAKKELELRNAELLATTAKLAESNRLLELAEEHALVGHWRYDAVFEQLDWSQEVFRLHGRQIGEQPTLEDGLAAYHPDDRSMVQQMVDDALSTGAAFRFEARIVQPAGQTRWVATKGIAERTVGVGITGLFGVIQDITEQVKANELLIRSREAVEQALAAKAAFTATVTHEIRTPLTTIRSCATLLRSATSAAQRESYLGKLEKSTQLLSVIVDDVLLSARMDGGGMPIEDVAFDLERLAAETLAIFTDDAARKGVGLLLNASLPGAVKGDPARLQRILTNLVGNAVKFTDDGSVRVEVGYCSERQLCRLDIVDTGIGVPPERLDAIFEPFVQAHSSTTRTFGGTGLGLSICRQLVDSLGGSIGVESVLGQGSRFWFKVPLKRAEGGLGQISQATRPALMPATCRNILIAEDNDFNRELLCDLVRSLGHRTSSVANGVEAVEAVRQSGSDPFDAVLLDFQMPLLDGVEVTAQLRLSDLGPCLPIYIVTAHCSAAQRQRARAVGVDGVIDKPVDLDGLARILSSPARATMAADEPSTPLASTGVLDAERIRLLQAVLGKDQQKHLLRMAAADLREGPGRVRAVVAAQEWEGLDRELHRLVGTARSIGASQVASALSACNEVALGGDGAGRLVDDLDRAAQEAVRALTDVILINQP